MTKESRVNLLAPPRRTIPFVLLAGLLACSSAACGSTQMDPYTHAIAMIDNGTLVALQSFDDAANGGSSDQVRLVELDDGGEVLNDLTAPVSDVCDRLSSQTRLQSAGEAVAIHNVCGPGTTGALTPPDGFELLDAAAEGRVQWTEAASGCGSLMLNGTDLFDTAALVDASSILSSGCSSSDVNVDHPTSAPDGHLLFTLKLKPDTPGGQFTTEVCSADLRTDAYTCDLLAAATLNSDTQFPLHEPTFAVVIPYRQEDSTGFHVFDGASAEPHHISTDYCIRAFALIDSGEAIAVTCDETLAEFALR